MMTNEELVELIQAGDRDRLLTLWEQTKRLALKQAHKWVSVGRMELEDLLQVGFIALMEAARTYDRGGGSAFSTWFVMYITREFHAACGQRTEKQRREPLLNAVSLDQPMEGTDGDPLYLADILEDPAAEAALEAVYERDRLEHIRAILEEAISALTPEQQDAVRGRYWRGEVVNRGHATRAIARLRHPMVSYRLREYL